MRTLDEALETKLIDEMPPKYRLILITHGPAPSLDETVQSFADKVSVMPSSIVTVIDGQRSRMPPIEPLGPWEGHVIPKQSGFCTACAVAWDLAREDGHDFVFWLENDFRFDREIPIEDMVYLLRENEHLAQIQLMRGPVNEQEKAAGGIVESRPGQFIAMRSIWIDWMQQSSYFTTNPFLAHKSLFRNHDWPLVPQCEGVMGIHLKSQGLAYGVMGHGEPWVTHIGTRTGFGY